ncbi:LOW QUALITY PROTEIN: hypothetical protein HID58_070505, partial [Brassica napus]
MTNRQENVKILRKMRYDESKPTSPNLLLNPPILIDGDPLSSQNSRGSHIKIPNEILTILVAGNPFRFSLAEFQTITGLPGGPFPEHYQSPSFNTRNAAKDPLWQKLLGHDSLITVIPAAPNPATLLELEDPHLPLHKSLSINDFEVAEADSNSLRARDGIKKMAMSPRKQRRISNYFQKNLGATPPTNEWLGEKVELLDILVAEVKADTRRLKRKLSHRHNKTGSKFSSFKFTLRTPKKRTTAQEKGTQIQPHQHDHIPESPIETEPNSPLISQYNAHRFSNAPAYNPTITDSPTDIINYVVLTVNGTHIVNPPQTSIGAPPEHNSPTHDSLNQSNHDPTALDYPPFMSLLTTPRHPTTPLPTTYMIPWRPNVISALPKRINDVRKPETNLRTSPLGFTSHATTTNAFAETATKVAQASTTVSGMISVQYLHPVYVSDSSPARPFVQHEPTKREVELARHLVDCKTVPATKLITVVDPQLWDLFSTTLQTVANMQKSLHRLHIYQTFHNHSTLSGHSLHVNPMTAAFTNNALLRLVSPTQWVTSTLTLLKLTFSGYGDTYLYCWCSPQIHVFRRAKHLPFSVAQILHLEEVETVQRS